MRITLFKRINDTAPSSHEVGRFQDLWAIFSQRSLQPGEEHRVKTPTTTPAFSPAEFDGIGSKNDNVQRVHFGVIDVDGKELTDLERILTLVKDLEVIVYSTWANHNPACHKPGPLSFRVVFPFSRPVDVKEWRLYWAFFERWTLGLSDPVAKDVRRAYYFPTAPHPWPTNFEFYRPAPPGAPGGLDVDAALEAGARLLRGTKKVAEAAEAEETPEAAASLRSLTHMDLADVAASLRKRSSPSVKAVANALQHVIAGKTYAEPGDRDKMLFRMTNAIADFFPSAEPTSVAELFRSSVIATCAQWNEGVPDDDLEKVVEKLSRAQEQRKAQRFETLAVEHERLKRRIKEAWAAAGVIREDAYTEEDIAGYAREAGTDVEGMKSRWIVQCGESYYVFFDGTYLPPLPITPLRRSLQRDLSPAHTVVNLFEEGDEGELKPVDRILDEYATVARKTIVDLSAQRSKYDPRQQAMIEASCPVRTDVVAAFQPEVDAWLHALFGERYEQGADWISVVTLLHKPCVAMYLAGPAGVGKTLLAEGLARIWTKEGVTALGKALDKWNEGISGCPLIFADETLPQELLGKNTTVLREFQQNRTRKLSRKFMPDATMVGAIRLLMAANNDQLLQTSEHLSEADIQAITERFLYMPCRIEARAYLESLGDVHARAFVDTDQIAKHALYLRETRALKDDADQGRFFIKGGSEELATALSTSSGVRSLLCQWMCSFLFNRQILRGRGISTNYVFVRDGLLHCSPQAISDHWDVYLQHHKAPMMSKIADALEGLGTGRTKMVKVGNAHVPLKLVNSRNLEWWAEHNGIATREEVIRQLALPCNVDVRALNGYENPTTPESDAAAAAEVLPMHVILGVKGGKK